jgi:broad specificity phosphatase PhoE
MSEILLLRHGQASFGSDNYDALSELGLRQARRLGSYLLNAGYRLDGLYSGTLQRQRQTAAEVIQCYSDAGVQLAPALEDPGFNEMDSEGQIQLFAPQLAQVDARVAQLLDSAHSDKKAFQKLLKIVFNQWLEGAVLDNRLETWPQFKSQVLGALAAVQRAQSSGTTSAVFTSGGVIATLVAHVLAMPDTAVYSVYEPIINCSITRLLFSSERMSLSSYNEFSYLQVSGSDSHEPDIISYR